MKKTYLLFIPVLIFELIIGCKNADNSSIIINNNTKKDVEVEKKVNFVYNFNVENPEKLAIGDNVKIFFEQKDSIKIDSFVLFINNNRVRQIKKSGEENIETKNFKVGVQQISIIAYAGNHQKKIDKNIEIFSDIVPAQKKYSIVNSFKHDPKAYTQGLYYADGIFYESTGLETKSSLRKVDPKTGDIIFSIIVPENIFGEGITMFNNKIYQITWQDYIAYVYDKETFSVEMQFNYNTEGWGLTNDSTHLYMSDGSNIIHIVDPNSFAFVDEIQVYDNNMPIKYLNELEFINGYIYANVYGKDYIVVIEPKTGKVVQKINLSGILPKNLITQNTDVLNGIAYDAEKDKIYVTGKNWARIFEIKIVD